MSTGSRMSHWGRAFGAMCLLSLAWVLMVHIRVDAVDRGYSSYIACGNCLGRAVWVADTWLYVALLWSLLAGVWLCARGWRLMWLSLATAAVLIYTVDLTIFKMFGTRLHPADIFRYGGDVGSAASVITPILREAWFAQLMVALILVGAGFWLGWARLTEDRRSRARRAVVSVLSLTLSLGALAATWVEGKVQYVHAHAYRNLWAGWATSGEDRPFSKSFVLQAQQPADTETKLCTNGSGQRRSVILVVVESLSAYHSKALGGHWDATPRLDARLPQGSHFESFVANGFTTDGGLISLLAGKPPLPAVGRFKSSQAYRGFERPYHERFYDELHAAGYSSQFFTTGRLDFLGKGDWLRELGIQTVEGAEGDAYQGLPKGSFDDVGDAHLYRRYLAWFDRQDRSHPVFSTLLTVSTHPPFVVPGTSIRDELSAFKYADEALDVFLQALSDRGYFDRGVVMVVGDHRAMTVVQPQEVAAHGAAASAMPWAAVFGHSDMPRGRLAGRWQQMDFLPTLAHWAGLPSCTDNYHGRFAGREPRHATWVLHAQGQNRDRVLVWRDGVAQPFDVMLDGDATRWATSPGTADAGKVIGDVNRWRAQLPALGPDEVSGMVARRLGLKP